MLTGRAVLITGGTGSFGTAFVETVLERYRPSRLIVFSRDELKQHEMRRRFPDARGPMRYLIGDVRDRERLRRAFEGVDIVVHAAALKQVEAAEYNPIEAVNTNINGARNVIEAALDCGVERVVALSTDKASAAVNLYGATKAVAEKLFVQANSYRGTNGPRFACVRYGNVLGSRGSVIPLFERQRASGTITLTDPRMTRFWITLRQGVEFVLSCLGLMHGGEVFVPKLPSMSMAEVARAVAPDCVVQITGIRPGEKLHETLITADEARQSVDIGDRYVIQPAHPWWSDASCPGGTPLPEGAAYTSDTNPWRLRPAEFMGMIESGNERREDAVTATR